MNLRRGSVMLFVMVFLVAITTVLIATAVLGSGAIQMQTRNTEAAQAQAAFDGAVDQIIEDDLQGRYASLPATPTLTVGGITVNLTVLDNWSLLSHSIEVDGSTTI